MNNSSTSFTPLSRNYEQINFRECLLHSALNPLSSFMLSTAANTETSVMLVGDILCEYADQIKDDEVTLHVAE